MTADTFRLAPPESLLTPPLQGHWSEMRESEHFVQFYENDTFLVESVGQFVGSGLGSGSGAIVIATPSHRAALEEQLRQQGIDVESVKVRGQFVPLDAAETLAMFMVNGMPDERLFTNIVGDIVAKTSKGRRNLRAFGEMVALLWAEGKGEAAIRLEELWNSLAKVHSFSLFCAYPMHGFQDEAHGVPFLHICKEHTRVIPTESYAAKQKSDDERLRTIALLQQKAAALEREVAERKRVESELRRSHEELESRVAERTSKLKETIGELERFSYSISHDMRSPLRAMYAYAQALSEDCASKLNPNELASLERIKRVSNRLDQLIRDVLAYSKISQGQIDLHPVDLDRIVNEVIQDQFEAAKDRIVIERPLRWVLGHEAYLTQCVSNLLDNALKFVVRGTSPEVRVRSEVLGDKVRFSVTDNGVGIKSENHDRIFQMFSRVYSEKEYEGTGIGLCIVKKALSRMGGEAGFNSELGKGSEFWFVLPATNV